jgi:hypothetical protein
MEIRWKLMIFNKDYNIADLTNRLKRYDKLFMT